MQNLLESVLVLAKLEHDVVRGIFDFLRERITEHIIDVDDEAKSDETLDDHLQLRRFGHGQDEHNLSDDWRCVLHETQHDIDDTASLATLRRLHILQITEHLES